MLQGGVRLLVLLIVEDSMTLGKGTTLDILARDAHVITLSDKRPESKGLGSRVINVLTLDNRLGAVGENTLQVAVGMEALRDAANDLTNMLEGLLVNTCREVRQDFGGKLLG